MPPFWISIALLSLAQGALVAVPGTLRAPVARRALRPPLGGDPARVGDRLRARRGRRRTRECAGPHLPGPVHGARARRARRRLADVGCPPAAPGAGAAHRAAVRARVGRPGRSLRGRAPRSSSRRSAASRSACCSPPSLPRAGWRRASWRWRWRTPSLVVSEELQRPNNALNAAHPAAGLPRLQSAVFGSAAMGYGDLFVAGRPRSAARGHRRTIAPAGRGEAHGAAGAGVRPAVLPRGRAPRDGARGAHAADSPGCAPLAAVSELIAAPSTGAPRVRPRPTARGPATPARPPAAQTPRTPAAAARHPAAP